MDSNGNKAMRGRTSALSRRNFLRATSSGLSTVIGAAWLTDSSEAHAKSVDRATPNGKVIIRTTSGGSYGAAMDKAIFEPFTRSTGIQVEKTPVAMAPLVASVRKGRPLVDVVDTSEGLLQTLVAAKVLQHIDYSRFKQFTIRDIGADSAQPYVVRRMVYARVLGYRTSVFPKSRVPKSWTDFWNAPEFPGARALPGLGLDYPDLEFALLADGVSISDLYPLNIKRAFASYSKIRPHIETFYSTDAISASLLSTDEVDLESIANGRIQPLIDQGGNYSIEWNQHMKVASGYSILNGARNLVNAYKFVDFAMSPEVQAHFSTLIPYGPINVRAFKLIPARYAAKLPTNPQWTDKGFTQNAQWWGEHLPEITRAWNTWAAR